MKKIKTPIHAIVVWLVGTALVTILSMFLTGVNTSGGAQIPMVILAHALYIIPLGAIIVCLLSPFFYKAWFRKYWIVIIGLIIVFSIPLVIAFN